MVDPNSVGQRMWRNQLSGQQVAERADEDSFSADEQVYLDQLARLQRNAAAQINGG